MRFRPCIDIHNGKVKQIVGSSLQDAGNQAEENFVSKKDAAWYAALYKKEKLSGGHVILLNPEKSPYYEETKKQALSALMAYPKGLMAGGGIHAENAEVFLKAGASHVIVTSYVFKNGGIVWENLEKMKAAVGKERLVLDVSCKKRDGVYYIVTDRWQKDTSICLNKKIMTELSLFCDEFLVHAVDVEGKAEGIEAPLAAMLGEWDGIPVTYAGGVHNYEDLRLLKKTGQNRVDVTIGSALCLFGGTLTLEKILEITDS